MTTRTISGYYSNSYDISSNVSQLQITARGGFYRGVTSYHYATISNAGRLGVGASVGFYSKGVYVEAGGEIINSPTGYIAGRYGVVGEAVTRVINYGTIAAYSPYGSQGVYLGGGGSVTNGSATATVALIEANAGVHIIGAAGTVTNFGTVEGRSGAGVFLAAGGTVTNGGGVDRTATIEGSYGVLNANGTVKNFGTIVGSNTGVLMIQGALTNGSLNNRQALVEGYNGASLNGSAVSTNFGTILGAGDTGGYGVYMGGGASLTNGAAGHARATVEGFVGVDAAGYANTVINFGTISGAAGVAVQFFSAADVLAVEAGCEFDGQVLGGGGTLDLASGTGTLTGNLAGGTVTVSGSMAATAFQAFNTVEVGAGATFATSGAVTIKAGQSVIDAGALTLGKSTAGVANAGIVETLGGTMTVAGAVTGLGHAIVDGGTLDFASAFNQNVTFTAATVGIMELARSQSYTATITGFSKTGKTSLDLDDIAFVSAGEATYSGTTTSGVLTVTDGTHTAQINLKGNYLSSAFIAASDGHGGTIVHDPKTLAAPPQALIAAMAALGAGGAGLEWGASYRPHAPPTLVGPRAQVA
ncbi:MAG TPA: hypothetical protein VG166_11155 [Caulobacteraceae bacterium]|jgi:hypothetical protein|nr:hypothetical protein [Caulobacteraceae bacterium]